MKNIIHISLLGLLLITVSGCLLPKDESKINWKRDKHNCFHTDSLTINKLIGEDNDFNGKSESYVIKQLGSPTETLLLERSEKFFVYRLNCSKSNQTVSSIIRFRFNAIGMTKEVILIEESIQP